MQADDDQMVISEMNTKGLYLKEVEEPGQGLESGVAEKLHKGYLGNVLRKGEVLEDGEYLNVVGPWRIKEGASIKHRDKSKKCQKDTQGEEGTPVKCRLST